MYSRTACRPRLAAEGLDFVPHLFWFSPDTKTYYGTRFAKKAIVIVDLCNEVNYYLLKYGIHIDRL